MNSEARAKTWQKLYGVSNPSKLTAYRNARSQAMGGKGNKCHLDALPDLPEGLKSGKYYVYVLLDTRCRSRRYRYVGYEPFYVGYGKLGRVLEHFKEYTAKKSLKNNIIRKIITETGNWPKFKILQSDLTLRQAKRREVEIIRMYGRRDVGNGPLANHTDGGDGFTGRVYKLSDEAEARRVANIIETSIGRTAEQRADTSKKLSIRLRARHKGESRARKEKRMCAIAESLRARGSDSWNSFVKEHQLLKRFTFSKYSSARAKVTCTCKVCKTVWQVSPHTFRKLVLEGRSLCQTCRHLSAEYKDERKRAGDAISRTKVQNNLLFWASKDAEYHKFLRRHTTLSTKVRINGTAAFYEYQPHICVVCKSEFQYIPQRVLKQTLARLHSCRG